MAWAGRAVTAQLQGGCLLRGWDWGPAGTALRAAGEGASLVVVQSWEWQVALGEDGSKGWA